MSVVESVRRKLLGGGISIDWGTIEPVSLTQHEIHELLSSDRRRVLLSALVVDQDGEATLSDMAEHVARVENGVEPDHPLTSTQRKRAYISLYQTHIPKLERYGVIDWDDQALVLNANQLATELVKLDRGVSRASAGVPR